MYIKATIYCLLIFQFCINAQNWESVGTRKFNFAVDQLYSDTTAGALYSTGSFWMIDTSTAYGLAVLDSSDWNNAFSTIANNGQKRIVRFQGNIYVTRSPYVIKWNGSMWDTVATASGVNAMYNDGDSVLYILGGFTSVNSIPASSIAKFDGTNWAALDTTVWSGAVLCAYRFQGEMYFGGLFENSSNNIHRIARWDGATWSDVGGGVTGSVAWVGCMEAYNGFLYVGGYMETAQGNPGNHIARWNGSTWTQVGGGMWGGQVSDLKAYNSELWAVGQFGYAGGITATYIARYNGIDWCSVGTFDNAINSIAIFNNELYVGGGFWTVDGDSVNKVVKWIGGSFADSCGHFNTLISELFELPVQLYPNPSNSVTTFQFTNSRQRIVVITDNFGREIWRKETTDTMIEFPASEFSSGLYFYRILEGESAAVSGKFLIQH